MRLQLVSKKKKSLYIHSELEVKGRITYTKDNSTNSKKVKFVTLEENSNTLGAKTRFWRKSSVYTSLQVQYYVSIVDPPRGPFKRWFEVGGSRLSGAEKGTQTPSTVKYTVDERKKQNKIK